MKKYLMMGAAALTMGFAFVSCSSDDEIYNPKAKSEQLAKNYAEAFVQQFGQPAANQTWGFNQTRATRTVNVNGNMWKDRPALGETEEADVLAYMDMTLAQMDEAGHKYGKLFPVNLTDYFITQVHTGDDLYGNLQSPNNKNLLGSSKMNHLVIAIDKASGRKNNTIKSATLPNEEGWNHVNNFNASSSTDWGGNTIFTDAGTFDFAYLNSEDSKYHNRWIVVKGSDIDAAKYGNYYYVCFDFEGIPNESKTYFSFTGKNDSGTWQTGYNGEITGFYQTLQDLKDAGITTIKGYDGKVRNIEDVKDFTITRWAQENMIYAGDNNYSDWIIRLVAAEPDNGGGEGTDTDELRESGRIFCEDLGTIGDFDFNDVVFDAYLYESGKIEIEVFAAGGTLPIAVAGENITIGKMSNTGVNNGRPTQHISISAEEATTNGWTSLISIPIVVTRDITDAVDGSVVLTAEKGKAPQKICVPLTTKWVDEYVNINNAYTWFSNWVKDKNTTTGWDNPVEKFVDYDLSNNAE